RPSSRDRISSISTSDLGIDIDGSSKGTPCCSVAAGRPACQTADRSDPAIGSFRLGQDLLDGQAGLADLPDQPVAAHAEGFGRGRARAVLADRGFEGFEVGAGSPSLAGLLHRGLKAKALDLEAQ